MNAFTKTGLATLMSVSATALADGPTPFNYDRDSLSRTMPELVQYTDDQLIGTLWSADDLSVRDRALVSLAALVSTNKSSQLSGPLAAGLDAGLSVTEINEMVLHLAFYAGWPTVMPSAEAISAYYLEAGLAPESSADAELLPYNEAAEQARWGAVNANVRPFVPGLADDTDEVLFADIWRRPQLAPRDRSLVTVAALLANGQAEQLGFHLNRAMDNGLSDAEAGAVVTHLAYYAGWPNAFSAVPVVRQVLERRAGSAN